MAKDDYDDVTMMHIALDYDDTYTRDPDLFDKIIKKFRKNNCKVCIVSDRNPDFSDVVEAHLGDKVDDFYFTDGEAKMVFMMNRGIKVDIWIDDCPMNIVYNKTPEADEGDGPFSTTTEDGK